MTLDLREEDLAVLQAIGDGATDVTEIRESTTLTNRQINYSLTDYSLEEMGLVEVDRRQGREWKEFSDGERNVWKSKGVQLTDKGVQVLAETEAVNRFENMSKQELVEKARELEQRQNRLETMFKEFREKVMDRL